MRLNQLSVLMAIVCMAAIAAAMAPISGSAAQSADVTELQMTTDGVTVNFNAQTSRQILTFNVRVVGPNGYTFQDRIEGQGSLEWLPPNELQDGRYGWEAWVVTAQSGALMREITPALQKRSMDHHFDVSVQQIHKASGSFTVQANTIQTESRGNQDQPLTRRVASALLDLLVPSAQAQVASTANDTFTIQNPANNDCSVLNMYNDPALSDRVIKNVSGSLHFATTSACSGDSAQMTVTNTGSVGINTGAPADALHIANAAPIIRFQDTDDTRVWRQLAGGGGFRIEDQTAGNVPFLIQNDTGFIGIGTGTPDRKLHILHPDGDGMKLENTIGEQFLVGAGGGTNSPYFGFFVENITSGESNISIANGAPGSNFIVAPSGNTGMGTDIPAAALHVQRANNTANVLVEDLGAGSPQVMFQLRKNGYPQFNLQDFSQTDVSWSFRLAGIAGSNERFEITKIGTGSAEFELFADGSATFRGDVTANGVLLTSTREAKTDFRALDERDVLDKLASLEISQWRYKHEDEDTVHFGPVAEEFHETFGLSDGKTLNMIDTNGIAFAAIQALNADNEALKAENQAILAENQAILDRLAVLEALLLQ